MISLQVVRNSSHEIEKSLRKRGEDFDLTLLIERDEELRKLKKEIDDLGYEKNQLKKKDLRHSPQRERYSQVKSDLEEKKRLYSQVKKERRDLLAHLPNLLWEKEPYGPTEEDRVLREVSGSSVEKGRPYYSLNEKLALFDDRRGTEIAGSLFLLYRQQGARLLRALTNFMIDYHLENGGYQEIIPPYLVREKVAFASGHLPRFDEDMYRTEKDSLYLIPTGEVPLTYLHGEEILAPGDLPLRYLASTPCFRRERGAKKQGLVRMHQFQKVELYQITRPGQSEKAFEEILASAEGILKELELPYRVVCLSSANLGFSAAYSCDLQVWCPGLDKHLEVSTISNCLDFQARRAKIRWRNASNQAEYVHTLNGSGLALPRLVIAIVENGQTPEGEVELPPVLHSYYKGSRLEL